MLKPNQETMKRILFFLLLLITIGSPFYGRAQGPNQDRIEALKVAFITRQVQLTSDEAQKFWPIYNEYETSMTQMLKTARQKGTSEIEIEENILELHKKWKPNFLKAISEEKFDRLMKAERTWGEMLRKEMQRRKEGGGRQLQQE
jgi:hypothetical protein